MSNASFSRDIQRWAALTQTNITEASRAVAIELFTSVILDTPVDTGRLRGNWQTNLGSMPDGVLDRLDPSGGAATGQVLTVVSQLVEGSVFLANNLPYAAVVEFGQFPDPPKKGAGLTSGGFSNKAPEGMLRRNVARFQTIFADEVRRLGGEP